MSAASETDAIFCPDTLLFIVTNTTRSIAIYEASALKHVPLWLILGIPTILECLSYKQWDSCTLFLGDSNGYVRSLKFLQPKIGFLKKKGNDNVGIFYWQNLRKEKEFVIVRKHGKLHNGPVKQIEYFQDLRLLITCCKDPNTAIVITSIENIKKNEIYRIAKGVNCFALDPIKKILFTGSDSGIIEIWNIFLSKFMAKLVAHNSEIIDIIVIQSEHLLITYSIDAVLKLWDLVEYTCLQTIELQFSSFNINGKTTEWGIKNIFPGPPRQNSNQTQKKENPNEVYIKEELPFNNNIWEKSCILVTCCNYIANLETYFTNSNIQLTFPILAPPPLQNSVLIPIGWGLLKDEGIIESGDVQSNKNCEQLEKLKFILERNLLEENETKSSINYQIAMLESKKEKMVSKVALGAPYLSLDLYDIETIKLSSNLPINKKTEPYMKKINCLIQNATIRDNAFLYSESSSSNRSKSTKSSIFTLTPH
ncbi:hypothetical protein ABEB36_008465 [Hypothenemus hampei]|uniref:Uncharacterized protein n=1 Tax=Hypothenemus hampei TaxID=57062 RepID=A0ABD1EM36_HYPHA